ncbi:MAG TPA: hypothetical protein PKD10_14120 [Paracoccaceae bacterium]|nr:hypothetical protein [Paracoccaceae bacterium]HMO71883.1 hypothetical protein [Paracoccaceae bacterium]
MSNSTRAILALALVGFVAACAQKSEPVYVEAPVSSEPSYTGKYK